MIKVIWTFWRMKLGFLLQFYCCRGIAKFHIEIFIGQMHLTHLMKQSRVQWAEIDFDRYYQTFIWLRTHRLQKIDTTKYKDYLKSWMSISKSMIHLSITGFMKAVSLTMQNTTQNLLEKSPLGLSLNFGASPYLKDISFMQNHTVEYWFARYWPGSGCRCCVGFDWKVWCKSSLPLLDKLIELGIGALGTLRQNRFPGTPVANKTTLVKKPRGSHDFATGSKNLVVSWLDNKVVTCATNDVTCNLVSTAGGQNQPRNELMYQCRNLLRTTTSTWVMLFCSTSLCPRIEFALGQRNGGGLSLHWRQTLQWQTHWTFFALYRSKTLVC